MRHPVTTTILATFVFLILLPVASPVVKGGSALGPAHHSQPAPSPFPHRSDARNSPLTMASGLTVTRNFMPWVCQFCTWSGSESAFAKEYAPYAGNMTELSYEMYYLCTTSPFFCSRGYEGTSNDLTPFARQHAIAALPMLTSATLTTIQNFVDNNSEWTPFINAAVSAATKYGYSGYNIDWEPGSDTTAAGGIEYAHFLDRFANASHQNGLMLTVDFARWDPNFWNLQAFSATTTDTFMDMNYECPGTTFTNYLNGDLAVFNTNQIGEALDPESGCSDAQMVQLFGQVTSSGVTNTEWWALDDAKASLDNAHLWTAVHDLVYQGAFNGTVGEAYSAGAWGLSTNEHPIPYGGSFHIFTLGTDEQGYVDASLSSPVPITLANITLTQSLNASNYRIYEGNVSANGTILSSWRLPAGNTTLNLGAPPGKTPTMSIFFELAPAPGGTVGGYLSGATGTYAFFNVQLNGGPPSPTIASFAASPDPVLVNSTTTFSANVSGGTSPYAYAYQGLPPGCTTSNTATLSCTPVTAGPYNVTVTVRDANSKTATKTTTLTVDPAASGPTIVSFSAVPGSLTLGSTTMLNVTVRGGTPPYAYGYTQLPPGCASLDRPVLPCTPSQKGNFSIMVTVTDSTGKFSKGTVGLEVNATSPSLTVSSFRVVPNAIPLGNSTTVHAVVAGGTQPYTYAYSGLPMGCASTNNATFTCIPSTSGESTILLKVTDSKGQSAWSNTTLTVYPVSVTPGFLGLSSQEWELVLVALVAVAGVLLAVTLRRRRRSTGGGGNSPTQPWNQQRPEPAQHGDESVTTFQYLPFDPGQ